MIWKKIPGYNLYEISIMGDIRRIYKTCVRNLKPTRKCDGLYVIRLIGNDGVRKEERVHKLMQKTFMSEPPGPGYVLYHMNGDRKDNCLNNLAYITRQELGKLHGHRSRRKPVRKICPISNDIVEFYSSAREAARDNYISRQTVSDSCNRVKKTNMTVDGYIYEWDE